MDPKEASQGSEGEESDALTVWEQQGACAQQLQRH